MLLYATRPVVEYYLEGKYARAFTKLLIQVRSYECGIENIFIAKARKIFPKYIKSLPGSLLSALHSPLFPSQIHLFQVE